MGLMLATCSADGVVRIYEAPDVMNLSQWSLQHEISCKLSCSCISWNPSSSRAHSPMIAVGSDDNSPNILAKVQIYEYNENTRKYAKSRSSDDSHRSRARYCVCPKSGKILSHLSCSNQRCTNFHTKTSKERIDFIRRINKV